MKKAVMMWSGGKDSALALQAIRQNPAYEVTALLTTANAHHRRVTMHGVQVALVERQAAALGLPLTWVWVPEAPDMAEYEARMREHLLALKAQGVTAAIFGDIFLGDLRQYREQQMAQLGLEAVFPLWGQPTLQLVRDFVAVGYRAVVVCTSQRALPASFCGRLLDHDFVADLPPGVDPWGKTGNTIPLCSTGRCLRKLSRCGRGKRFFGNTGNRRPQLPILQKVRPLLRM